MSTTESHKELYDALISAHVTIGDNLEEKIRLRDQGPDIEASAQSAALLTDQLAAMSTKHQQAQAAATFNEDLDDRLKASIAAEREASARSNQQAASLVESAARLQQQLASSRANERVSASTSLE